VTPYTKLNHYRFTDLIFQIEANHIYWAIVGYIVDPYRPTLYFVIFKRLRVIYVAIMYLVPLNVHFNSKIPFYDILNTSV
jgi:hypothetical protein